MCKHVFSIIIPVYNAENFIAECLDSVLSQTFENFEVLVVNDGSKDMSGEICDRYSKKDSHIKVYHQSNQGQGAARNIAVKNASGDYCLFLDADDYWDSNLLETLDKELNDYAFDIVIFNIKRVSGKKVKEEEPIFEDKTIFNLENKEQIIKKLISGSRLNNLCNKAVKRSIINFEVLTDTKRLLTSEDLLLSLYLLDSAKSVIYVNKAMYYYRSNPKSVTYTFNIKKFDDITVVRSVLLIYLKKYGMHTEDNLNLLFKTYISSLLINISALANSNKSILSKYKTLLYVQEIPLYKEAQNYIKLKNFPVEQRVRLVLFKRKYFKLLCLYEKVLSNLRNFRNLMKA